MNNLIQQKQIEGLGGGALTPSNHRALDQLVHNVAETSYIEPTYTNNRPTLITEWTSVAKTTKIREYTITYSGGLVSQVSVQQYDSSGVTIVGEQLTSVPSYTGGIINNVTNTLT